MDQSNQMLVMGQQMKAQRMQVDWEGIAIFVFQEAAQELHKKDQMIDDLNIKLKAEAS